MATSRKRHRSVPWPGAGGLGCDAGNPCQIGFERVRCDLAAFLVLLTCTMTRTSYCLSSFSLPCQLQARRCPSRHAWHMKKSPVLRTVAGTGPSSRVFFLSWRGLVALALGIMLFGPGKKAPTAWVDPSLPLKRVCRTCTGKDGAF